MGTAPRNSPYPAPLWNWQLLPWGVKVYLDPSLRRFDIVYPACGSPNSAVKLTPEELELLSGGEWCDLCKLPEPAAE